MSRKLVGTWVVLVGMLGSPGCGSESSNDAPPEPTAQCGNNLKEGAEICDGSDLAGMSCAAVGLAGGTLACAATCEAFDVSGCVTTCTDSCGDGECCGSAGEDACTCPDDCGVGSCGDGLCCGTDGEDTCSCIDDCGEACGDGCCTLGETAAACGDCQCGDTICDTSETNATCPDDCFCGDGVCGADESASTCTLDCDPVCGDGFCDTGETVASCPADCSGCADHAACDDGNVCNGSELCDPALGCQPGIPLAVDDGIDCTVDACDATNGVTHTADNSLCDDADPCNGTETCDLTLGCQAGTPMPVDDGIPCTIDTCDAVLGAIHTPDHTWCDDGNFCNGAEACNYASGCVVGVPPPVDDGFACTFDYCDPSVGVVHTPQDLLCDDADPCNGSEVCEPGLGCQPGTPMATDDGIACTVDTCDPIVGAIHTPDSTLCDDDNFCNGFETCDFAAGCLAGTPPPVDDGVACTIDACDPISGITHTPDNALCDDGNLCNGPEICYLGLGCQPGIPPIVEDGIFCTTDSCDPVTGISHVPNDGVCSDGLFCTGVEYCDASLGCRSGTPPDPNDGIACTVDVCDEPSQSLRNTPLDTNCAIDQLCDPVLDCVPRPLDANGSYNVTAPVFYQCNELVAGVFLVNVDVSTLAFIDTGTTLTATPAINGTCTLTGPSASGSGVIDLSCAISAACVESYALTGSFSDNNTWTGTLTATYSGSCGDCLTQSWTFTGTRL